MWASADQVMALIGDAKQATSEGKGDPVETRLTRLAATALREKVVQLNSGYSPGVSEGKSSL